MQCLNRSNRSSAAQRKSSVRYSLPTDKECRLVQIKSVYRRHFECYSNEETCLWQGRKLCREKRRKCWL